MARTLAGDENEMFRVVTDNPHVGTLGPYGSIGAARGVRSNTLYTWRNGDPFMKARIERAEVVWVEVPD